MTSIYTYFAPDIYMEAVFMLLVSDFHDDRLSRAGVRGKQCELWLFNTNWCLSWTVFLRSCRIYIFLRSCKMFFSDLARCISQDNVSFDYYSMPSESNVSNICPLPTPGQLERLITIRSTIITNDDQLACQLAFVAHKTCERVQDYDPDHVHPQHFDRGRGTSFCRCSWHRWKHCLHRHPVQVGSEYLP